MTYQTSKNYPAPQNQRGLSLIELLVGIAISLLIIAVALGAIVASRSITGSVDDSGQLQQQASHIFRVMGKQLRQAGSLKLSLSTQGNEDDADINDPVAFEIATADFNPKTDTISGIEKPKDNQFKLTTAYSNYRELIYSSNNKESLQRDCLGENGTDTVIRNRFTLRDSNLVCAGVNNNVPQPIANNVAEFEVLYLIQSSAAAGSPQLQYANANNVGVSNWHNVYAVEVCIVLYGNEIINLPKDSNYTNCQGQNVDMSTLTGNRARRMHKVFRNVFQLRSQGLIGTL
ncbi:PilW family protein [Comamonas kerstersii]|uniref:Prepilin-type N-terminal cleavage/methylation domain-containing protein n=1 Tax=Comamonas kerstersii TaxID=225992 RepID=A0A6A1R3I5_9BURK|nr:PilW family protein [Comamonas kerstersii]KAB0587045.1 prepilin-type N-terminal cleavage/methylation domain-containing protein [Comamonas kerstersii]